MINLLPQVEKEKLRREYFLRLAVIALISLFFLLLIACVLLMPTFLLTHSKLSITQNEAVALKHSTAGVQKAQYEAVVKQTNDRVNQLLNAPAELQMRDLVRSILGVRGDRITLSAFVYQSAVAGSKGESARIQIQGVAKNRDELIAFQTRLQSSGHFSDVSLPISSLVSDTNIPFTMDLTPKPVSNTES
ncbi:MAG TPA: PilN domain-containing protein [Candidatus Paceibacterota bacterium]|nr:PilN domain-containing protein [Candidatus Paceibacterota bacterium]